ncbi:DNA sulfur modification protein DndD [Achromobacter sp. D10]|uniref:DNA sulfur modification protein DndD n=1 Tax=Achromobacter sp. D10 TaxID=3110765 RepID=UPI002B4726AC|nr:DNA sulfur modification protein DndD [Achromobacter sp. D10]MEB3095589.1 DNA sulfur modification protein DndD [Achromobacter sp. D10]
MWISKLELTCFKSYQRQVFEFPQPEDGKNIVLIGGMNGFGKTSILEALYLGLFGKDAIVHLARAGLTADDRKGYPTFLERAFNGEARREGLDTMIVRITIHRTKTKAVDIARKWFFKSSTGAWTGEEEAVVREISRDQPGPPRLDGKGGFYLSEMLDELFVPAHVAPFFFFDGEEVKKLADQSRLEQVKQGLEGLLGVVLLRSLADRLRNYEAGKRQEVTNVDERRFGALAEDLALAETQLATLLEHVADHDVEKLQLRTEQQTLLDRITSLGGGGGGIATVKELVEEREQVRARIRETQKALEEILSGRLPFHLAPRQLLDALKQQLEAEQRWYIWEAEKRSLEPRKVEFEAAFDRQLTPCFEPELSSGQRDALKVRMQSAWEALFYPPPDNCASEIVHQYLHDGDRAKTLSFLGRLGLGQKEIQEVLSEQNELSQRSDELGRKISRLEGVDRDGTLIDLKRRLDEVQQKIDQVIDRARADDRAITATETRVHSLRADYEREKQKLDASSPVRALIEKSERVRRVIDELIPALFPLKVKALGRAMTDVYKRLAHKTQVSKIEIAEDGSARILGVTGNELDFDRSAGENQIFATALIAGLAKVSGIRAPLVVDTPLGRLDSQHRENILAYWTSDPNRQVILLSQDEEIDYTFYQKIAPNVGKTYLLKHEDVGEGIGRTTGVAGSYFSKGRK